MEQWIPHYHHPISSPVLTTDQMNDHSSSQHDSPKPEQELEEPDSADRSEREVSREITEETDNSQQDPPHAPLNFKRGPWLDPANQAYRQEKRHQALLAGVSAMAHRLTDLKETEVALVILAEDEPTNYQEAMWSANTSKWWKSCEEEYKTVLGYHTWTLVEKSPNINIVESQWTFRVKRNNLRQVDKYKAQLVTQGFSQVSSLDFNETFSPTIRFTSIWFILAMACYYNLKLRPGDEVQTSTESSTMTYICVIPKDSSNKKKSTSFVNSTKAYTAFIHQEKFGVRHLEEN